MKSTQDIQSLQRARCQLYVGVDEKSVIDKSLPKPTYAQGRNLHQRSQIQRTETLARAPIPLNRAWYFLTWNEVGGFGKSFVGGK